MVRAGGFEPPIAWFVARYSIQLSYARTKSVLQQQALRLITLIMVRVRIRTSDRLVRSQVLIQLELRCTKSVLQQQALRLITLNNGARGRIRTSDRLVRSQVLYPAELCAH